MHDAWVYLFEGFSGLGSDFISGSISALPLFRQEKCARYRQDSDKIACIITYQLLARGLREQYGLDACGGFIYNEHGKPYLKDHPRIFFSISHCRDGAACALADVEVGLDIQDIRPFSLKVARRVCSDSELELLRGASDPARLFCRMWTEKESFAKARGISVAGVVKQDLAAAPVFFRETDDYCLSLCSKDRHADLTCRLVM